MADSLDSGSSVHYGRAGSSPASRTNIGASIVSLAPTFFLCQWQSALIRPLPCSSFPTATCCAGLAVGGPPCGRHFSPFRNVDFNRPFQSKRTSFRMSFCFGFRRPKDGSTLGDRNARCKCADGQKAGWVVFLRIPFRDFKISLLTVPSFRNGRIHGKRPFFTPQNERMPGMNPGKSPSV